MSLPTNEGMEVHWYFPPEARPYDDMLCEEYVTGDDVIDSGPQHVTCQECLEWLHA